MREMGVRGLLVYCSDYHCSHWTAISGDQWPDNVRLSDIEQRFTCQACGTKGADLRPNFSLGTRGWARGHPGFGSQGTLSIILVWFGCLAHVSACGSLRGPVRLPPPRGGTCTISRTLPHPSRLRKKGGCMPRFYINFRTAGQIVLD